MCSFAKTSNLKTETKLQDDPEAKIYSRPDFQLGLYEWIQNSSTLKSTKPGHTNLNANNYGRNGHWKIDWKSIEILVDSQL